MSSTNVGSIHYDLGLQTDKFDSAIGRIGTSVKKFAQASAVAFAAVTAGAVAFGVVSVKAYAEAEAAGKKLRHAVINVTKATEEELAATEKLADELERKGVLDGDNIKTGIAQLSTFGLSNKAVQALSGSLADLAVNQYGVKATGDDLTDTANMIAKALNGQFGVLEKSGIRFTEAQKSIILYGNEMEKVKAINEGFAQNLKYTNEVAMTTFEGKMARLSVQFDNFKESVGLALVNALSPFVEKLSAWAASEKGQAVIQGIATAVGNLAEKMSIWASTVAIPWVQQHWPGIKNGIKGAYDVFKFFVDFIKGAASGLGMIFSPLIEGIKVVVSAVRGAIGWLNEMFNSAKKTFKTIMDGITGVKNQGTPGWGNTVDSLLSNIPKFATGTRSAPGGMSWVGERGPELVNLPRGSQVIPNSESMKMAGQSSSTSTNIYGNISIGDTNTADYFLSRLTRDQEVLSFGIAGTL